MTLLGVTTTHSSRRKLSKQQEASLLCPYFFCLFVFFYCLGFFVPLKNFHSYGNGYLRGPVTLIPIAERLAVGLSLPVLRLWLFAAGIRTHNLPLAGPTLQPIAPPLRFNLKSDLFLRYRIEDLVTYHYGSCLSELCINFVFAYCVMISTNQMAYFKRSAVFLKKTKVVKVTIDWSI